MTISHGGARSTLDVREPFPLEAVAAVDKVVVGI